jgi:hypothetical protein
MWNSCDYTLLSESTGDLITIRYRHNEPIKKDMTKYICIYLLLNVSIKSRRMRWAGHVARMGQAWSTHKVLVG